MTKNNKLWAMSRVLRSGEETPRSGEGPRNGEGPPCHDEAEKEEFSILGFATAKLRASPRRSSGLRHGEAQGFATAKLRASPRRSYCSQ